MLSSTSISNLFKKLSVWNVFLNPDWLLLQACHIPTTWRHWRKVPRTCIFLILYGLPKRSSTSDALDWRHFQKVVLFASLASHSTPRAPCHWRPLDRIFRSHQPLLGKPVTIMHLGLTSYRIGGFRLFSLIIILANSLQMLRHVQKRWKFWELRKFHGWTTHPTSLRWTHSTSTATKSSQHKWLQFGSTPSVLPTPW